MKNLSLILNIVLLIAVGVLYYLHFSGSGAAKSPDAASSEPLDVKIAYISTDSILKNYDYAKEKQQQLEEKTDKLNQDYRNRIEGLQNDINSYQRNAGNLTLSQARAVEEDLAKKRQNLQLYEQSLSQHIMEEQNNLSKELYDRITSYLKEYGRNKGLQVVLKFDPSSDVLFAGDSLDVTSEVIAGLNKVYSEEAKDAKSTAGKDSTAVKK